jgi:hypothetical protein
MENINRKRIILLQIIIFNFIIFLFFISIVIFKTLPEINLYEQSKNDLQKMRQELNLIKNRGISYSEFIDIMSKYPIQDAYLEALIKTISQDFYDKNVVNKSNQSTYEDFIKNKEVYLGKKAKESDVSERQKSVQAILPEYTWTSLTENEQALTDFKFISYIESILYAFNLVSVDAIWVSNVLAVDDYVTQEAKKMQQEINPKIYYIPLSLTLTWKKSDIIDFFQFTENVGSISIDGWKFSVLKDDKINKNLSKKNIEENYNIYENQIFDIEGVTMAKYIDSDVSSSKIDTQEFINFIKETQWNEKFIIDLRLRFYVKWMPDYQIKNFIKTTLDKYNTLKKESDMLLSKAISFKAETSTDIITMNKLRSVNFDLKLMEPNIKNLRNSYAKSGGDVDAVYKESMRINLIFESFESILNKNKQILDSLKNNK